MVVAGLGGGGKWKLVWNGYWVSVGQEEEVLWMDGGNGCKAVNVLNATELYT